MGHTIYWTNWCRISQPSTVWKMSIQCPASYEHIENQGAILYTCKCVTSVPSNFEDLPLHPHICALLFGFPPESITPLCRNSAARDNPWDHGMVCVSHYCRKMTSRLLSSSMSIQPETYDAKLAMYIHIYIYIIYIDTSTMNPTDISHRGTVACHASATNPINFLRIKSRF